MSGAGQREVAQRLFAVEFRDATYDYTEGDEDRSPNYVVSPTGARVNRLFAIGVLTANEWVSDEVLRVRIADPTGAFISYAGQYQPKALGTLEALEPPTFIAMTGKARTFKPDDGDRIFTSIRPEAVNEVDGGTRDRWVLNTAELTLQRIDGMARAIQSDLTEESLRTALYNADVPTSIAAGIPIARREYAPTLAYLHALREITVDAVGVIAGELEEVDVPDLSPSMEGDGQFEDLLLDESPFRDVFETGHGGSGETSPTEATNPSEEQPPTPKESSPSQTSPSKEDDSQRAESPEKHSPATNEDASTDSLDEDISAVDVDNPTDDPEFELDEETRATVEDEFGTEFQSGTDVPDAGETLPEETEPEPTPESSDEDSTSEESEDDEVPEAIKEAVVEQMRELDEGDGADREALVAAVVESEDVSEATVEDAIQEALMDGLCYEPAGGSLKAI